MVQNTSENPSRGKGRCGISQLRSILIERLEVLLQERGGVGEISLLQLPEKVADDTLKVLITNQEGRPVAVILWSSSVEPQHVATNIQRAREAKAALGNKWGSSVLEPILAGEIDGRSFGVFPYCEPLANRWLPWLLQRIRLWPGIRDWLRAAIYKTVTETSDIERTTDFLHPLHFLADNEHLSHSVRRSAARAADRLSQGQWVPRYILAHNDLWKANILLRNNHPYSWRIHPGAFVIIDWAGAQLRGHAIYDLIRLALSLRLPRRILFDELGVHCKLLQCDHSDAHSYLLASLGYLGLHLNHFPESRYHACVEECCSMVTRFGV